MVREWAKCYYLIQKGVCKLGSHVPIVFSYVFL